MNLTAKRLIEAWLEKQLTPEQWQWLQQQLDVVATSNSDKALYVALGMAPRKLGKTDLALSEQDLKDADDAINGWHPSNWSVDGAARILTLLNVAEKDPSSFAPTLKSLCNTADVAEANIYYQGLILFPHDDTFEELIGHGLRTNMRAVFEAIAHNNPYPAKVFDEHRWNHMVLKALFIDSTLHPIQGLDKRANPTLASILCDYAHERWAAHRFVTPELWRCVGPFATTDMLDDLVRASNSDNNNEHCGAMLALSACPLPEAASKMAAYPKTAEAISTGALTWDTLVQTLDKN